MKSPHQKRVEKFMKLAKQEVPDSPTVPSDEVCRLRASLILEETLETIKSLGCEVLVEGTFTLDKDKLSIISVASPSMVEICDGCADLSVVTIGTLSAIGVEDQGLLELVDENNLEKFGEGHSFRPDGKLIKPPSHTPPDIAGYLGEFKKE